jgi:hypothetical protein
MSAAAGRETVSAPEPAPIEERIAARKAELMAAGWAWYCAEARARDDMARMAEVAI